MACVKNTNVLWIGTEWLDVSSSWTDVLFLLSFCTTIYLSPDLDWALFVYCFYINERFLSFWTKKKLKKKKKLIMINITIVSKFYNEQNLING